MRILYIAPFQHPSMRGPTRHYHFLRELSREHRITLLTLTRTEPSLEALDEMSKYTERLCLFDANGSASEGNRIVKYLHLRAAVWRMRRTFLRLIAGEAFDVVLFHGKAAFGIIRSFSELPVVEDFCDATSMRLRAKMGYVNWKRLPSLTIRYLLSCWTEKGLIKKTPHLAFISDRDRRAVLGEKQGARIIPNGIDLQFWKRRSDKPAPNRLVFTGVMDYAPNQDAALYLIDEILPRVRRSWPGVETLIVGRNPMPALRQRAETQPDVVVTGYVDDIRPYLERATVFVAPLRYASGMQNKIQEALAMEVPVVTTSIAAEGLRLPGKPEPPVIVAEGANGLARATVRLLGDEQKRASLADAGRRYAEEHYRWSRNARLLEQMCTEAARERRR